VLVMGGTGRGVDDHAAAALAAVGQLAVHGVALLPGETTGLGQTVGGVPVVLLPGAPAACLWSYELLADEQFGGLVAVILSSRSDRVK